VAKKKNLGFRAWFYFRQGWSTYFAFVFAAVNTMVVTYYLAIKDVPLLKVIFPSFLSYMFIVSVIGIPILIFIGYVHYKKIAAYSSEADIIAESHPYFYKLQPGYSVEVLFPLYRAMTNMLVKMSRNEKLTEKELEEISELQKKVDFLINGGSVKKLNMKSDSIDLDETK
jgi:hypothetical protein